GVFRRLARSDEPVYVPADGDLKPRLVIPVRAGNEWLGSIWIVVESRPDAALVRSLRQTASVVALHLLRLRSQTDLSRRVAADRLRAALTGLTEGVEAWLPAGPWRVVVLDGGPTATTVPTVSTVSTRGDSPGDGVETRIDLWESAARRRSWRQPLLAVHDGVVLALVTDAPATPTSPGTWGWLREVVDEVAAATTAGNAPATASAGALAMRPVELDRSRREALEVHRLRDCGRVSATTRTLEQSWAAVTTARCVAALQVEQLVGPVQEVAAHDAAHDTAYAETIAAWLDHPGDPRSAAAGIHVHPNTLRYRLQRLGEIVELDLHDPETRLAVRLQLRALGH
ncbi:MAG: helix-turn-helix domain-containing protein, partial [Terracoccus sp.]